VQAQARGGGFQHGQNMFLRYSWFRIQEKTLFLKQKGAILLIFLRIFKVFLEKS